MKMYVDSGKAYVQVATGALILPIVFLRNLLGVDDKAPLGKIPWPMWVSWAFLLFSIAGGLMYQSRAVGYLENAMEGDLEDDARKRPKAKKSVLERFRRTVRTEPGIVFDFMAVSFYLGMLSFVVGAVVQMTHYHPWLPYVLYAGALILTRIVYLVL
jgi:hypothetical protein